MKLVNEGRQILIEELEVARTLWPRTKGLLGRRDLPANRALWIWRCNAIHTWFMRFPIDLVFLNRRMEVTKTYRRVRPWRMVGPVFRASSVIELREGFLDQHPIQVGEKLHVDPALS